MTHSAVCSQPGPVESWGSSERGAACQRLKQVVSKAGKTPVRTGHQSGSISSPAFVLTGEQVSGHLASGTRIRPCTSATGLSGKTWFPQSPLPPHSASQSFPQLYLLSLSRGWTPKSRLTIFSFGKGRSSPIVLNLLTKPSFPSRALCSAYV